MDCIVNGVTKSQMRLSDFHFRADHFSLAPLMGRGYHKSSRQRSAVCSLQLWPQKAEDGQAGAEGRDSNLIACTLWAAQREEPSHQATCLELEEHPLPSNSGALFLVSQLQRDLQAPGGQRGWFSSCVSPRRRIPFLSHLRACREGRVFL